MSTKADALIRKAERGDRVGKIREALGMTGDQFAKELASAAKLFGLKARYDKGKVSRMETGGRNLTAEETAILTLLDPEGRGPVWLVFGKEAAAKAASVSPMHLGAFKPHKSARQPRLAAGPS